VLLLQQEQLLHLLVLEVLQEPQEQQWVLEVMQEEALRNRHQYNQLMP
jgi:hypothetical protein